MRQGWENAEPDIGPIMPEFGRVQPLAPSGTPIADVANIETDVTAIDQAAVEEAFESTGKVITTRPTGFILPFIIGFGAAWIARQWKVL
mgnify:CR=1 FL=1